MVYMMFQASIEYRHVLSCIFVEALKKIKNESFFVSTSSVAYIVILLSFSFF